MDNNFERASRIKLRVMDKWTVEDLWDLHLQSATNKPNLDDIGMALRRELRSSGEEASLITPTVKVNEKVQLAFDIVKHIIDVRLADAKVLSESKAKADEKQRLLSLLADKQDEALRGKSIEEIREMIAKL